MRSILFLGLAVVLFILARYFYFKPNYVYGEQLPQFEVQLLNGQTLTTQDLQGDIVLLHFWGSWCGPCRQEAPDVVALHASFGHKQFEGADAFKIFSIGIETDKARWIKAMNQEGFDWEWHFSALERFKGPLAKEFGVRQIPTRFLIDEKGMVVGVDLSFKEIQAYLKGRLSN